MNVSAQKEHPSVTEIQDWLVAYLAQLLNISSDEIDVTTPFDRFGLSSMTAVQMTGDLEEWLSRPIDPTLPYDYPTVEALSGYLALPPSKKVAP